MDVENDRSHNGGEALPPGDTQRMTSKLIIDAVRTPRQKPDALWGGVIDAPRVGEVIDGERFLLDGWIIGADVPVVAIEASAEGGVISQIPLALSRPDVAAHNPHAPKAEHRGYRGEISVADFPPAFSIDLAAVLADERRCRFASVNGRYGDAVASPSAEATSPWPHLALDWPTPEAEFAPGAVVTGWAFSVHGMEEVSVWLDGERLGRATSGTERRDVAAAHPQWLEAAESGFWYGVSSIPAAAIERGTAELTVTAEDQEGHRRSETRTVRTIARPALTPRGSIDIPKLHDHDDPLREAGWSSPLVVYGWAIDVEGIDRIDVLLDGEVKARAQHGLAREDIEYHSQQFRMLGLSQQAGWVGILDTEGMPPGEHALSAVVHGRSGTFDLPPKPVWLRRESARADPARQARLDAILRCLDCGGPLERRGKQLICTGCERTIPTNEFGTLLFEETYAGLDWREAGATSHGYPPEAAAIITGIGDGLVLDVGAGLRENLPNVIQLDAIPFPTDDVSAGAEAMPFADESFDAVVACNLLEHVSSPEKVIAEIRRLCKLGGQIYVDWTSVHPYHGFPHHYFNATETGLDWMMREVGGATGETAGVAPQVAVWQVLNAWLGSLDDPGARAFVEGMTVAELVNLTSGEDVDPERYALFGRVFPGGQRLVPAKVTFTGVREH